MGISQFTAQLALWTSLEEDCVPGLSCPVSWPHPYQPRHLEDVLI